MKTDCFGFKDNKCIATFNKCLACSFYKTKEQFKQDFLKSKKRIDTLPEETKIYIADKYPTFSAMCKIYCD